MSRRLILAGLFLVLGVWSAAAQTITSYELRAFNVGATTPLQVFPFTAASATCGLSPDPSTNTVNPTKIEWKFLPADTTVCRFVQSSGTLFSLPVGNYEARLVAFNAAGPSPESNTAPFARQDPPGAPAGLRLYR